MKKVYFTSRVIAHQTFEINVTDEQYEELFKADSISGETLAEYIEDNLYGNDIEWGDIEDAQGIQAASIYDVEDLDPVEIDDK